MAMGHGTPCAAAMRGGGGRGVRSVTMAEEEEVRIEGRICRRKQERHGNSAAEGLSTKKTKTKKKKKKKKKK
jgi:hypothetical protein